SGGLHAVARLLARIRRPADADVDQETPENHAAPLCLSLRLDGGGAALEIRPAAGPEHAREDHGSGSDRGDLHVPPAGGCAGTAPYLRGTGRSPREWPEH